MENQNIKKKASELGRFYKNKMIEERVFRLEEGIELYPEKVTEKFEEMFERKRIGKHISTGNIKGAEHDTFHISPGITMEIRYYKVSPVISLYGEEETLENFDTSLLNKLVNCLEIKEV